MRKYCEICCVSIIIYIKKKSTNGRPKKKKNCNYNAAGTVATVRNFKKKKSASPNFHYRWTMGFIE